MHVNSWSKGSLYTHKGAEIMSLCFPTVGCSCLGFLCLMYGCIVHFLPPSLLNASSSLAFPGVRFATSRPCWTKTCLCLAAPTLGAARLVLLCVYLVHETLWGSREARLLFCHCSSSVGRNCEGVCLQSNVGLMFSRNIRASSDVISYVNSSIIPYKREIEPGFEFKGRHHE